MNVKDLLVSAAGTQYLLSTQYTQDEYYTGDLVDFSNKLPEKDSTWVCFGWQQFAITTEEEARSAAKKTKRGKQRQNTQGQIPGQGKNKRNNTQNQQQQQQQQPQQQQQQQPQRQKAKREDNPNEEQPAAKKARVSYQACPTCKKFYPPLAYMQRRLRISLVCMRNWLNQLGLAEEEV